MSLDLAESAGMAALVLSGFLATNLDNLLILVGLLGAENARRSIILLAYIAAAGSVLAVSVSAAALGQLLDPAWLGYLGTVPICLGAYLLYGHWKNGAQDGVQRAPAAGQSSVPATRGLGTSTFLLMFSNSGDSIAVFLPLAADSNIGVVALIAVVYLLATLAWVVIARMAAGHPRISSLLCRLGAPLVPWIMIIVGTYILLDTGTDRLLMVSGSVN